MMKIVAAATIIPAAFIFTAGVLHSTTPIRPDTLIVVPASYNDVNEDDDAWSCTTMGNHVCGPDNVEGVNAGCYDDDAEMVAPWPCHTYVDEDGERNVMYDAATFDNGALYKVMFR